MPIIGVSPGYNYVVIKGECGGTTVAGLCGHVSCLMSLLWESGSHNVPVDNVCALICW